MKYLILKYIGTVGDAVLFKVHEQSHRGVEFGNEGMWFTSHTPHYNFRLKSEGHPASYIFRNNRIRELYVRGYDETQDNELVTVTINHWNIIKDVVQEYNEYYGFTGECIIGEMSSPILPEEMFTL